MLQPRQHVRTSSACWRRRMSWPFSSFKPLDPASLCCPEFCDSAIQAQIPLSPSALSPQICFLDISLGYLCPGYLSRYVLCFLLSVPLLKLGLPSRWLLFLQSLPVAIWPPKSHLRFGFLSERFLSVFPTQTASSSPLNTTASFFRSSLQSALSCICCILGGAKGSSEESIRHYNIPRQPPCKATSNKYIITHRLRLLCKHSFKIVSQVPFASQLLTLNSSFIEILKLYPPHFILSFSGPQLRLHISWSM